jgi:hypothetical protein
MKIAEELQRIHSSLEPAVLPAEQAGAHSDRVQKLP